MREQSQNFSNGHFQLKRANLAKEGTKGFIITHPYYFSLPFIVQDPVSQPGFATLYALLLLLALLFYFVIPE